MESFSSHNQSWLSWFFRGFLILGSIVLLGRTFELSIIKSKYYRDLSEGNRIRKIALPAPRGRVIARGGEILAGNREIKKKIVFNSQTGFEKTDDLTNALPEEVVSEYERYYNLGEKAAHLTGYLGVVNENEVGKVNPECPEKGPRKNSDLIGRSGLEQNYDCLLRGIDGEELIEVDTMGRKIRVLGRKEAIPGEDLKTNINYDLQEEVGKLFSNNEKGGIIVSDPQGQILAFYSSPSFNPNYFVGSTANKTKVQEFLDDSNLPLFNRLIGGLFHPGSVFKPTIAIAALEEGKIDTSYTFNDQGQIEIKTPYGNFVYNNWYFTQYGGKEGEIDLTRALARSTDTFFYKIGELTGIEKLNFWAEKLGFNKETGIDLAGEIKGLVPTPEWKEKVKKESWFLGNTYHFSIGQGDLAVTPIEINHYIAAIANNGKICIPQIVQKDGKCENLKIEKKNLDLIKEGMTKACSSGGTGYTFFDFTPQVACKTGTAETNEDGKTHAWFVFFAPNDFPEIVTTVLVEGGGEGSKVAGPIAREVANFWFKK